MARPIKRLSSWFILQWTLTLIGVVFIAFRPLLISDNEHKQLDDPVPNSSSKPSEPCLVHRVFFSQCDTPLVYESQERGRRFACSARIVPSFCSVGRHHVHCPVQFGSLLRGKKRQRMEPCDNCILGNTGRRMDSLDITLLKDPVSMKDLAAMNVVREKFVGFFGHLLLTCETNIPGLLEVKDDFYPRFHWTTTDSVRWLDKLVYNGRADTAFTTANTIANAVDRLRSVRQIFPFSEHIAQIGFHAVTVPKEKLLLVLFSLLIASVQLLSLSWKFTRLATPEDEGFSAAPSNTLGRTSPLKYQFPMERLMRPAPTMRTKRIARRADLKTYPRMQK
eukprot:gb/GECG01012713.1/.p1 GENE.gb/GECG01012713.1/~~gb/GECG01012713.1/.p1  ORF type:complete len:335 (+),score=17.72 gb/GECG01012713.1/:1-1005(+)